MATEQIPDGYRVWGSSRSWIVEHYKLGQLTWSSRWFRSREFADAEMRRLKKGVK